MGEPTTYIKLDRSIMQWRWYQNGNTFRVFLHCLLSANIEDCDFEEITIHRGEFSTSYAKIAKTLGMSLKEVRTAIAHLKGTGEIKTEKHAKYQVICVLNYDLYQDISAVYGQAEGTQRAVKGQQSKNNIQTTNNKHNILFLNTHAYAHEENGENVENSVENVGETKVPSIHNIAIFFEDNTGWQKLKCLQEAEKFFYYNEIRCWDCLTNWQAAAHIWILHEEDKQNEQ